MTWIEVVDIVLCAVLLRFLMGWLLANRRVARLVITLLSLFIFQYCLFFCDLISCCFASQGALWVIAGKIMGQYM